MEVNKLTDHVGDPEVRRPSRQILTDETYDAVKRLVMDHRIPPGARVSIEALARDLGVSPTPVREALARLEADGLVVKEPLRGNRTTPVLNRREFEELYEMRLLLEPWAARQAAGRMTAEGRQRLLTEMTSCLPVPPGSDYETYRSVIDHDARFHDLVFALAGNELVRAMWNRTHCHLHLFRLFYAGGLGAVTVQEHGDVADALVAGDAESAEAAMRRHLEASRSRLLPATREP